MAKLNLNTAEKTRVRLTLEQQKHIQSLYSAVAKDISKQLKKAPRVPSDSLRKMYLKKLQEQINEALQKIRLDVQKTTEGNMRATAEAVVQSSLNFLEEIHMPVEGAFSHVPDAIVKAVATGQLYEGNWTLSRALWKHTKKTQSDVQSVIAMGIAENKSAYDIAKDLEKYVDPKVRKDWEWSKVYPGTNLKVDYNAQRLARTMVSHAYQYSFVQTTKDNPFVTKYKWRSAGGERTCEICRQRNGVEYAKDSLPLDHPNGMCTFLAVMDDMTKTADRLADWVQGKADPALDVWVKSMGVLKQKAKREFQSNMIPVTYEQLKQKYPVKFIGLESIPQEEASWYIKQLDTSLSWTLSNIPGFSFGSSGTVSEIRFENLPDCVGYISTGQTIVHIDCASYSKTVSTHEFVHATINQVMKNKGVPSYDFSSRDSWVKQLRKRIFTRADLPNTKANIRKYISDYAATDNEEFLAEAIGYGAGQREPNKLTKTVIEVFKEAVQNANKRL